MPLFNRKPPGDPQDRDELARRTAQREADRLGNIEALERGGVPVHAQRRLADMRERNGSFFTSNLSVNEFLLSRESGLTALSQVMGSSIFHVGWQRTPGMNFWYSSTEELAVVSAAMNTARERALLRLAEEAHLLGAHAVTGVRITRSQYEWGRDLIDFTAVGTAVTIAGRAATDHPVLTNLSGQDYWTLQQAGAEPSGLVASSTVYYIVGGMQTQYAMQGWGTWSNQELTDFTNGIYAARHRVMDGVAQQARSRGAAGVVGMQIEHRVEEREVEGPQESRRTDLMVTFHVVGTAVAGEVASGRASTATAVVNLKP